MPFTRRQFLMAAAATPLAAHAAERAVVFAAASLKPALDPILQGTGHVASYGGSGAMARQILAGAPADLFISAHPDWMDVIEAAGLVQPGAQKIVAANRLVVIGPKGAAPLALEDLSDALGTGRLAMGERRGVPAGRYGQEALTTLRLWPELEGRLAEVENVRLALALVLRGEVPYGLVYASDALGAEVEIVAEIPEEAHRPILYPAALLTPRAAGIFADITGPRGRAALQAAGFLPPPA